MVARVLERITTSADQVAHGATHLLGVLDGSHRARDDIWMPRLEPRLVTRAAPLASVAASSVPLFWHVVDLFDAHPGEWQLTNSRFELRRYVDMDGRWLFTAILDAFTLEPGYLRLLSWINVKLCPPPGTTARHVQRATWFAKLAQAFQVRGYTSGVHPLTFARRLRGPRAHAAERRWIEALFAVDSRRAGTGRPRTAPPVWTALRAFRGDDAGEWVPVNAGYEIRRPFAVLGRRGGIVCTKLHPIQWDMGARAIRRAFVVDASVTVWLPDLTRRELARLRESGWHSRVVNALRSLGYRGGWRKIKGHQPFGDFWKNGLRTIDAVRAEHNILTRLRLPVERG